LSKLLERLVNQQLVAYLKDNLLSDRQWPYNDTELITRLKLLS